MPYNDFTEMPVWQKADEIVGEVYKLTETLPKREDYALCSQLRDAAISIAGNIAEGFGRGHKKDKINFYFFSRGSCFEVRSHLYSGRTVGYFSDEQIKPIGEKCMKVVEELNKIIKGLGDKP
jgi:four helix bundle protein